VTNVMERKKYEEVLTRISSYYEDKVRDDPAGNSRKMSVANMPVAEKRSGSRKDIGRKKTGGEKSFSGTRESTTADPRGVFF